MHWSWLTLSFVAFTGVWKIISIREEYLKPYKLLQIIIIIIIIGIVSWHYIIIRVYELFV